MTASPLARNMSEKQLLAAIREYARLRKWLCYHTHDSRRSEPGFPDLVLARDRLIVAELKSEKGRLTEEQRAWITTLENIAKHSPGNMEVFVWRPLDWVSGYIETVLR